MSSERESLEVESAMEWKVIRERNRECRIACCIDVVVVMETQRNETNNYVFVLSE